MLRAPQASKEDGCCQKRRCRLSQYVAKRNTEDQEYLYVLITETNTRMQGWWVMDQQEEGGDRTHLVDVNVENVTDHTVPPSEGQALKAQPKLNHHHASSIDNHQWG